jgi:hypothetical protein
MARQSGHLIEYPYMHDREGLGLDRGYGWPCVIRLRSQLLIMGQYFVNLD